MAGVGFGENARNTVVTGVKLVIENVEQRKGCRGVGQRMAPSWTGPSLC